METRTSTSCTIFKHSPNGAWAQFAVVLHKLRKTGAGRRYLPAAIRVSRSRRENTCAIIRIFLKAQYWTRKPVIGLQTTLKLN
jgi:hypothetical protein